MSGAHPALWPLIPRGTAFEDHTVGRVFNHHWGRTVHAADNVSFSTQTLAFNPVHFNRVAAREAGHPDEVVNPLLVFAIVFGLSVEDLSEAGGPFLGAQRVRFLRDVYPGDTLYASSTVVEARGSRSRPESGIVTWHTTGRDADGDAVVEFERTNLVRKRAASGPTAEVPEGYAEDFTVGSRFRHARTRTITDLDLNSLTLQVMNTAAAHFSEVDTTAAEFGGRVNFGGLTLALTVGLAMQDTVGQAVRELGMDDVRLRTPVRHGDTIGAATEVLDVDSVDGGDAAVTFRHLGLNQRGETVCQVARTVQVRTRLASSAAAAGAGR